MTRSAMLIGVLALLTVGCNKKKHSIPRGMSQPLAKIDYTILGATNHEECGTYILAIDWGHLFANQSYADPAAGILGFLGSYNAEASRALYHAADKMPEATHLVAPRVHSTSSGVLLPGGVPLFGERCSSVEAHGLKTGTKPAIHYAPLNGGGGGAGDVPAQIPLLDEAGNPVLDEAGNPVFMPAPTPVEGEAVEGAEGAAPAPQ